MDIPTHLFYIPTYIVLLLFWLAIWFLFSHIISIEHNGMGSAVLHREIEKYHLWTIKVAAVFCLGGMQGKASNLFGYVDRLVGGSVYG